MQMEITDRAVNAVSLLSLSGSDADRKKTTTTKSVLGIVEVHRSDKPWWQNKRKKKVRDKEREVQGVGSSAVD